MRSSRLQRDEWVALSVALLWSVALIVLAVVAPAYQSTTQTSSGAVISETSSLFDENGAAVLLPVGVPLLVSVVVGFALWRREASRGAGPVAWTGTVLLAAFNVLAMASIGLLIVPVTAALVFACVRRQGRKGGDARQAGDLSITPM